MVLRSITLLFLCRSKTIKMKALNLSVFIILIAIVVHKQSNVVYGANIPNSIRSHNKNHKNINVKAMEDALEHVGISPQVS